MAVSFFFAITIRKKNFATAKKEKFVARLHVTINVFCSSFLPLLWGRIIHPRGGGQLAHYSRCKLREVCHPGAPPRSGACRVVPRPPRRHQEGHDKQDQKPRVDSRQIRAGARGVSCAD